MDYLDAMKIGLDNVEERFPKVAVVSAFIRAQQRSKEATKGCLPTRMVDPYWLPDKVFEVLDIPTQGENMDIYYAAENSLYCRGWTPDHQHDTTRQIFDARGLRQYSKAAFLLLRYLCRPDVPCKVLTTVSRALRSASARNRPWLSRTHQRRRTFDEPAQWRIKSLALSNLKSSGATREALQRRFTAYFVYRMALYFLPHFLDEATYFPPLFNLTNRCILNQTCVLFPRQTKIVKAAISRYSSRWQATNDKES